MAKEKEEALRELLLILADRPDLVETLTIKPNKLLKQGQPKGKDKAKDKPKAN